MEPQSWNMTPAGVIQYAMIMLLMMLVWLVKSAYHNQNQMLKDMREEHKIDREDMKEECRLVRIDHREDMKHLLADSEANRKTFEEGFDKIAAAIAQRGRRT